MTDPLVGTTVAHYEVLARLGGGGMGVVYTARDMRLERVVALKFLPSQWSHDDTARQRFVREAQAASATHHRNICTIHDIETTADGRLFIVMAYYAGQTLKQKLDSGALPVEEAVEVAGQIAEGLAKAHGEGVVHRDIKPGNLILVDGDVKILDFGLAKFANSLQLTIEGSTLGTVAYMSPEQTRGDEADARSDIWAVGVVLFEMLTGALPFKGAYAEAISHAIRNDPVPALAAPGRDFPPELTRIVNRALAKDPAARYQSVREMARDLRALQGRTIPIELLPTTPIVAPPIHMPPPSPPWWRSRKAATAAALLLLAAAGLTLWVLAPVDRIPVIVAPVVNQTGYTELDGYRAALTQELVSGLTQSPVVRVLPYDRELQILRRFRENGQDISSREALQALTANSGATIVIAPTLAYENGGWRARLEFRDAATATNNAVVETAAVVSSLPKDTAYGLMAPAAAAIDDHFLATGARRARMASALRRMASRSADAPQSTMRTLDAAAAFERGVDLLEQMEYATALDALDQAIALDPRNALLLGWRSLVAHIMRRDDESAATGDQALRALNDRTSIEDRLFVEAVAAESRRDIPTAAARFRAMVDRHPDDAAAVMQLAAFQDRQNQNADAVVTYLSALQIDPRLARPHVELCRMYNRLNEAAKAKEYAQKALTAYQAIGARNGEGQARFCLADALRVGSDADREQAKEHAEKAVALFTALNDPYNLARAYNYSATIAGLQNRRAESAAFGEKALESAKRAGNIVLQPLVLMNLGVTYNALGDRARAADRYRQSAALFEALGDQARAAEQQMNSGALLIEFGPNPDEGVRNVRNALAVMQKLGNKDQEVFCLQMIALYQRNIGQAAEAERTLNQALAIARERDLVDRVARIAIRRARVRLTTGDFSGARQLLNELDRARVSTANAVEAALLLARADVRLGDFDAARAGLARASAQLKGADEALFPLLETISGELAYESGNLAEARSQFGRSAARWTDAVPDEASVEAGAYLGLLDAMNGRPAEGRRSVLASLEHAHGVGWLSVEAFCRVLLARIDVGQRKFEDALATLRAIPPDSDQRTIGAEVRAYAHYWQMQALIGRGDPAGAKAEEQAAREMLEKLRSSFPADYRALYEGRPDIHRILR